MGHAILLPDVEALAARVPDGSMVAIGKTDVGPAMELTRALVRRGVRGLHLVCVPTSGLQADLLIGAGCVAILETAGVTFGELGHAPAFGRAVREGRIELRDSTCPAIYAGLQAGEKGIPFMPIRGLIGSDVAARRADFKIMENPFGDADLIIAVRSIRPDYTLIHAPLADRHGNVWIGRHRGLMLMAHAAKATLVTVERIVDDDLLDDPDKGPATIPSLYIDAVATAQRGAWPYGLTDAYDPDMEHLAEYLRLGATPEGLARYIGENLHGRRHAAE